MRKFIPINLPDEIADIFAGASDLNRALPLLMKKVKSGTGTAAWSLLIDRAFTRSVPLRTTRNIRKCDFDEARGITGLISEKGKSAVFHDISKVKKFDKDSDGFRDIHIETMLCSPLKVKGKVVGILRLINKKKGVFFTEDDRKLLADVSLCAGIVLERAFLYRRIEDISITDDLTGLFNIRFLNRAIDIEIERSRRYGSFFTVIFMDIDDLKKVNLKHGHLVGSKVLIETGKLLEDNLRKVDMIIRYGGDEFVIILPQTPREAGFSVAERLRRTLERNIFLKDAGLALRITASFGVASFPDNAKSKDALIKIADKAMFNGKLSTKNVVFIAN